MIFFNKVIIRGLNRWIISSCWFSYWKFVLTRLFRCKFQNSFLRLETDIIKLNEQTGETQVEWTNRSRRKNFPENRTNKWCFYFICMYVRGIKQKRVRISSPEWKSQPRSGHPVDNRENCWSTVLTDVFNLSYMVYGLIVSLVRACKIKRESWFCTARFMISLRFTWLV